MRELRQMFRAAPDVPGGRDRTFLLPTPEPGAQVCKQTLGSLPGRSGGPSQSQASAPPPNLGGTAVVLCLWPPSPVPPHTPLLQDPSPPPPRWLGHDLIRGLTGSERVLRGGGRLAAARGKCTAPLHHSSA